MSVNGRVIRHTPLAVDFWQVRKCPHTRLFFLSHMHSDHTVGLTSTWCNRPIYCSPVTASLLRLKLQVKEQWIHPLELGDPYLLPLDDIGKESVAVTLIDSNHCPGAVMFLFEGYFGSILYTGDFRYTPSMLRELCLRTNATIDVLYLDNTNCDPNRSLPSRHQATQQIKELIRSNPDHNVVIGLYTLGKESLLVELAMEFKTWIEVSVERMEILKALELPEVFTTEPGAGRIRAVQQSEISLTNLRRWNNEELTLAIFPTSRPLVSFHPKVHVVPYSDHSSYQELVDFVSALQPTSLIPIVGHCFPGSFTALLPRKKQPEILVPESVLLYMMKQPESQMSSSSFTSLHPRHVRSLAPKGVIFESPVSSAKNAPEAECLEQEASEEMDTESSDKESDYIVLDLSKKLTPDKNRRRQIDPWSLNIVRTVPEEVFMSESLPFSQLSQSNFGPTEIITNTKACLKPVRNTTAPFETWNKRVNETEAKEDYRLCMHSRHGHDQNNLTLSDEDCMSRSSGQGIGQDTDMIPDSNTSQDNGHGISEINRVTNLPLNPDTLSCASSSYLSEVNIEEVENSILKDLDFSEEDFKSRGLWDKSILQQFPICPLRDANDDNLSDK